MNLKSTLHEAVGLVAFSVAAHGGPQATYFYPGNSFRWP
jgi:hypothetical protein